MTMHSSRRGAPGKRAQAAIDALRQRYEQQVTDLDTAAELAEEIAEREEKFAVVVARLQEGGMSVSDLANCTGMHPNRLRRLIERHNATTDE
ncbi:hypothetical protein [Corynebacterium sp. A21]|uniref:hypothetical protein n=1 Tax=Corynebacterium sp. A21 TaxID=3457318 RepID=UPI003FD31A41